MRRGREAAKKGNRFPFVPCSLFHARLTKRGASGRSARLPPRPRRCRSSRPIPWHGRLVGVPHGRGVNWVRWGDADGWALKADRGGSRRVRRVGLPFFLQGMLPHSAGLLQGATAWRDALKQRRVLISPPRDGRSVAASSGARVVWG
jgi:hypothetical protein